MLWKLPQAILVAAFLPFATADFWLTYLNQRVSDDDGVDVYEGGTFTSDPPQWSCDDWDIFNHPIHQIADDVSGSKHGMRVDPKTNKGPPLYRDPLDVVEFNTWKTNPGHQTIYADRGYVMVDINGHSTGQCHLNRTFTIQLFCGTSFTDISLRGSSMFFCETHLMPSDFDSTTVLEFQGA
ncbi:hypothetical protein F5Y18DRAFT_432676 [Xylariaceae sp. FL1019]|nr:hypothetical protein F5Y18DRAFT_432676 [Xylariaceae sp. FL1019]